METRPKRKDSFFGMHFDFHAGREQAGIGAQLDEDTLEQLISRVKPDYVQCDTKGHAGNSSYPRRWDIRRRTCRVISSACGEG